MLKALSTFTFQSILHNPEGMIYFSVIPSDFCLSEMLFYNNISPRAYYLWG
jgi:hypothetical protein